MMTHMYHVVAVFTATVHVHTEHPTPHVVHTYNKKKLRIIFKFL